MNIWETPLNGGGGDYPVLPAGIYEFTVKSAIGAEYKPKPGGKIGHCAQIKLTLIAEGIGTNGKEITVNVFENLYSDPNYEWKMTAFAKSTGIWHEEMTPADVMNRAQGMTGTALLKIGEWNGRKRNEVERFIVPETAPAAETEVEVTNDDLPF